MDFRTKMRCYEELKNLYGMKHGEYGLKAERDQKGRLQPNRSSEHLGLSEDAIAKDVGFSRVTLERAQAIEKSDLPEEIKNCWMLSLTFGHARQF